MKLATILSIIIVISCGNSQKTDSNSKFIHGENDLVFHTNDDQISQSIGLMKLGCTVTHIGGGRVITAGHCVDDATCDKPIYDVTWGVRQNNLNGNSKSKCLKILAVEDEYFGQDYAILQYDNPPIAEMKVNKTELPSINTEITMHSHPLTQPLMWSKWCKIENINQTGFRFFHLCDAESGSSGAPFFNKKMELVGVHNGGSLVGNIGTFAAKIPFFTE